MLKIYWKIGKKPRGNWLTPLEFRVMIEESDELLLNPYLHFVVEYKLPEAIILVKGNGKVSGSSCRKVEWLAYNIKSYFNSAYEHHIKESLNDGVCGGGCSDCKAYLPWRPGIPDYSDFEEVFRQVAQDMCDAWNRGVQEALESPEYGQDPVVITSADYHLLKESTELANKPVRRVKV